MADSVDFITFVCRELNHSDPSLGFDTFEVGSVNIPPPSPLNGMLNHQKKINPPPHADARDAVVRQILDRPVMLIKKKIADHQSTCQVINNEGAINISTDCDIKDLTVPLTVPEDIFLGSKFEETKRKLREQYENIENEKKKRRIQIVDFQKPVPSVQTKAKKPAVKKQKKRNALQLIRAQLHRVVMFPFFDSSNRKTDRDM